MPLTKKGQKIMKNMKREYGGKKGTSVFYASRNKGTISGVDPGSRKAHKTRVLTRTGRGSGGGSAQRPVPTVLD